MRTFHYKIAGGPVRVHQVETVNDIEDFYMFLDANRHCLALDTETTGTDIYSEGFSVRLVQFGNGHESYVLPVEQGNVMAKAAVEAVSSVENLILHNPSFDLQVFDRCLGVPMEKVWPKVTDTRILAHLIDPRGPEEGGIGHSLEALTATYISEEVATEVKGLMARLAKEHKTTKSRIWAVIDLDHTEYNLYAGMDPILTMRLCRTLWPKVPASSRNLIEFERKLSEVCSYYERTGFLLDVGYSSELSDKLREAEEHYVGEAEKYGVETVNSTDQVAEALIARGVTIPERTPTGKYKVDKHLLDHLIKQGDPLATAVKEAKKARKWRTTWVDGFLAHRDELDRCHPNINPLRARTARMSITGIPAQTLPSSDFMIRRCFLADEGHRIASIDYQAQELRVLAALSGDATMIEAFRHGADLHLMTAQAAFGNHVTKDDVERKWAKTANFQKVYGGGPKGLTAQIDITLEAAKKVHDGFDKSYPGVTALSRKLSKQAERDGHVVTPSGRRLPVDSSRSYAALNYVIQSASRDVTAQGLLNLHHEGFTPFIRLPVHDEVVASLPELTADAESDEIGRAMATQMGPVWIGTDPEVGLRSWGSLYQADY